MKKVVFFIILLIVLIVVPITVYFVGQQQELRSRAAPATVLALNPGTVTKNNSDTFSFDVQIDTGGNNVAMAELHLTYDATALEALSITNGPIAPKIAASGVVGGGAASITVRAESTTQPIRGTGTIAVIRFKAIGSGGQSQIKFTTSTYVSGLGENNPNVLVNTIPATVQITGSGITPTVIPTIIPTVIPTIQITPQPTATDSSTTLPTESLTPTISLESTPSAEASNSAIQVAVESDESGMSSNTPVIRGTAPPGSTVTIVIHSDPVTVVVTTDENGHYIYTPTEPLAEGTHTIVVTSQNPDGTTGSATSEFTVAGGGIGSAGGDEIPTSGSVTYTMLLIGISILLLFGGVMIQVSRIGP